MAWTGAALWWLPVAAIAAIALLALVEAVVLPAGRGARIGWVAAVAAIGSVALAAALWQQRTSRAALGLETAQLHAAAARLDAIDHLLPAGPDTAGDTVGSVAAAIGALNARIRELDSEVETLRENAGRRRVDDETAAKLADYLRPLGPRRVVVSCAPDDVEAYLYANQIANLLHNAGWEAPGPEPTAVFGDRRAMAIGLYVGGGEAAETAKLLTDGFVRFDIPYRTGVAPSGALPQIDMVELYVPKKPEPAEPK